MTPRTGGTRVAAQLDRLAGDDPSGGMPFTELAGAHVVAAGGVDPLRWATGWMHGTIGPYAVRKLTARQPEVCVRFDGRGSL